MLDTRLPLAGERWVLRPLVWGQHSETGPAREANEDTSRVVALPLLEGQARLVIAAVADGMGGHAAGEVASRVAVDGLLEELAAVSSMEELEEADILQALQAGFAHANLSVQEQAEAPLHGGMGSTLTAIVIWRDRLLIGHIGDSRVYRLREGRLEQLTRDHSVVQEKVELGLLTPEEALRSVQRNQLRRAIGTSAVAAADLLSDTLTDGDALFLATDGAYASLEEDDYIHALSVAGDPQKACEDLSERAAVRDGSDNITLVCIATQAAMRRGKGLATRAEGGPHPTEAGAAQRADPRQRGRSVRWRRSLMLVLAVDILVIAAVVSFPAWQRLRVAQREQQGNSLTAQQAALPGASPSLEPDVRLRLQVRLEGNTVRLHYQSSRPLQVRVGEKPPVPLANHTASPVPADSNSLADQNVELMVRASEGEDQAQWSLSRNPDQKLARGKRHLRLDGEPGRLQQQIDKAIPTNAVNSAGRLDWPVNEVEFYIGRNRGIRVYLKFANALGQ
jgi:PPM family protein phosphatase